MKKSLLFFALLTTTFLFNAKAQITVLSEGFDNVSLPSGWTVIDADNDGQNWMHSELTNYITGYNSSGAYVSFSKNEQTGAALTPDNWLISPAITLGSNSTLTFRRLVSFFQAAEHYGVFISTTSATDLSSFTMVYEETPTQASYAWALQTVDLSNYSGTVYIAFRHFNVTNMNLIALDEVLVTTNMSNPIITVSPIGLQFPNAAAGIPTASQMVTMTAYNITGSISATTNAPFEVSSDNVTFATTATLSNYDTALYVRYFPTVAGTDTGTLTLTSGSATASVLLSGDNLDCGTQTLPYQQNFDAIPEYSIPSCWTKINPFDGYPKVTDNYSENTGDNVLMFKCNYNNYEPIYAVMPQMPEDLSSLQISFYTFREGISSGTLSVGYVTNPNDSSTFVPVWSVNAAQLGDNNPHPYTVIFDNVATDPNTTYYIAFKYMATANWYWFVDDIVVEEIPDCSTPSNLTLFDVTSSTATVSWDGNANQFIVYYKMSSDTVWTEIPDIIPNTDGYVITGLAPSTTYNWYVASVCADGSILNSLSTGSFTTDCSTFTAPYLQNFDAAASVPQCWERYSGLASSVFAGGALTPASTYWLFNNTHVFGAYHPKINIYGISCHHWLVSPPIDLSSLNAPTLTFDLALTSWNSSSPIADPNSQLDDKFMVIISTDNGATWSASNAIVWSNDNTGTYIFNQIPAGGQEITIPLTDYANQTVTIAFYGESTSSGGDNDLHIDNVMVSDAASCPKPTNFTATAVTSNSVTLTWSEIGTATSWNIEYGPSGFQQGSSEGTLVQTNTYPYTIDNLSVATYDFYLQSNCGGSQSLWVGPIMAAPGSFNIGVTGIDTLVTCSQIIYDNGGAAANYDGGCDYRLVIYPETAGAFITINGSYHTESCCDYLRIYDGAGISGTLLGEFKGTGTVPTLVSSTGPLTLTFYSDGTLQYDGFELFVTCATCTPPANLTVSNISSNSADITWTGTASSYLVQYMPANDSTWITQTVSNTMLGLTGLSEHTEYTVIVSSDCDGSYSPGISINFTTTMIPTALPYSTDFSSNDNWIFDNGSCGNYWTIGDLGNENALFITNNGTTAGYTPNSTFSVVSAEKLFTVGNTEDFNISFDVNVGGEGTFDYLKVFFAPASANYPAANTFVNYANYDFEVNSINFPMTVSAYSYMINLTGNNTVHVEVTAPNPNDNPTSASTAKLVFLWKNDHSSGTQPGAIVYNVAVSAVTCPAPIDLTVSNLTTSSATISWTPTGNETAWAVKYMENGDSTWSTVTVNNTPACTLSGLTTGSSYQVCVQSLCGSDDLSMWLCGTVSIPCDAITAFPYTEDFENGGFIPECWSQEYVMGGVDWTFQAGAHSTSGITTAHSGNYNAYFFKPSYENNTTRLISPIFDLTNILDPHLTYWYAQKEWGSGQDHLVVYYRTSPTANWQTLAQHHTSVTDWTMDSLALPNPSATYQLAFEGFANSGYGIVLDDIVIDGTIDTTVVPEPCEVPTNVTVIDSQDESLTVSWDANANVSSWNVRYRQQGATTWSSATANTNSITLTDLAIMVYYEIQVQADCGNGNTSDWSETVTGYTLTPAVPEYLNVHINLYPNPANDVVNVQCTMNNVQVKALEVFDVYGKLINTVDIVENPTQINVSGLASGVYFVRVTTDEGVATKSFVKK